MFGFDPVCNQPRREVAGKVPTQTLPHLKCAKFILFYFWLSFFNIVFVARAQETVLKAHAVLIIHSSGFPSFLP